MAELKSPMAGTVLEVRVAEGDEVSAGDEVVVIESMKMEIPVTLETGGTVTAVLIEEGDFLNEGDGVIEYDG